MNKICFTLAISAVFFFSSCSTHDVKNAPLAGTNNAIVTQHSVMPQAVSTRPQDGNYPGKGKVTKINMELGSVELDHEEIVGVMPKMIMEFYVKEKWLLYGLKVGDNVDFILEYEHPAETIVSIKKAQ